MRNNPSHIKRDPFMCSYNVDEYQTHTSTLLKQRTLVLASIFAPLSNNSRTMFVFPLLDATCNGVIPFCKKEMQITREKTLLKVCKGSYIKQFEQLNEAFQRCGSLSSLSYNEQCPTLLYALFTMMSVKMIHSTLI